MIRKLLLSSLALFSLFIQAQNVSDGFYRVKNYGTNRYVYVYDCTGSINVSTTSADMGAIVLYRDANKRFSDPASVIYVSNKGKSDGYTYFDLEAQGTGVYKIINYYVSVTNSNVAGTYWVYVPKFSLYLVDPVSSASVDKSYVDIKKLGGVNANQLSWSIYPVSATSDEYLGIAPSENLKLGNKYYKPYVLAFAYDFASAGMKAYYVSAIKEDAIVIKEVVGTVPAETPVIVECSSAEATNNRINPLRVTPSLISGNCLKSNFFCYNGHKPETARRLYNPKTMRVLAVKDGKLQYITDTNHEYTTLLKVNNVSDYYVNANESYVEVPENFPATIQVLTEAEYNELHPTSKKGDVNSDGDVNSTDVAVLYRIIAAGTTASVAPAADVNGDGTINSTDVALLYRIIAAGK